MSFKIVRALEDFPREVTKSIFLLGPIPRRPDIKQLSWKAEAYQKLEEFGYDGIVFDPEHIELPDRSSLDYDGAKQIDWEIDALNRADVIVAWIPRQLPDMPALTSNIEMGEWFKTGKMILGYPDDAERMRYIDYRCGRWLDKAYKWQVPICHDLRQTLYAAIDYLGDGALRRDGEAAVPLNIWQDKTFSDWYIAQTKICQNVLENLHVEYVYFRRYESCSRPQSKIWCVRPKIRITKENRFKDNELVIGRPNMSSVLMYYDYSVGGVPADPMYWEIVLIKEYRAAVMNIHGLVLELPGGSIEPLKGPHYLDIRIASAIREVEEEVGITLDPSRLEDVADRQTMATLTACTNDLFTYRLNYREHADLTNKRLKRRMDQAEDNAENTGFEFHTVRDLLSKHSSIDWVNMGMIMSFIVSQGK